MENVERFCTHYPELEPISAMLKEFAKDISGIGAIREKVQEEEVRSVVVGETGSSQECLDNVRREMEPLKANFAEVPLNSLVVLREHLQAALKQNSEFSQAIGGNAICDSLSIMLEQAEQQAPSYETTQLDQWIQEFVRETINESFERNQQAIQFLSNFAVWEHCSIKKISELSKHICAPDFRADRVELLDRRSVLVQELIATYRQKQRAVQSNELTAHDLLEEKVKAFEKARSASFDKLRDRLQLHKEMLERIERETASLENYSLLKAAALVCEEDASNRRRDRRRAEVCRVVQVIQEGLAQIVELMAESRNDDATLTRRALEKREAEAVSSNLVGKFGELKAFYASSLLKEEKCAELEKRFADWIREAYSKMHAKLNDDLIAVRKSLPIDKARATVLSRIATEQIRAQRDEVKRGVEKRRSEMESCQEDLSLLEFSKPTGSEVSRITRRIAELQASLNWQQDEIQALTVVEQRLMQEAAHAEATSVHSGENGNELSCEGWTRHLSEAETWAGELFQVFARTPFAKSATEKHGKDTWHISPDLGLLASGASQKGLSADLEALDHDDDGVIKGLISVWSSDTRAAPRLLPLLDSEAISRVSASDSCLLQSAQQKVIIPKGDSSNKAIEDMKSLSMPNSPVDLHRPAPPTVAAPRPLPPPPRHQSQQIPIVSGNLILPPRIEVIAPSPRGLGYSPAHVGAVTQLRLPPSSQGGIHQPAGLMPTTTRWGTMTPGTMTPSTSPPGSIATFCHGQTVNLNGGT